MSQSQIGKLYKFYLRKIWQKNKARIIVFVALFTLTRFAFPHLSCWWQTKKNVQDSREEIKKAEKELSELEKQKEVPEFLKKIPRKSLKARIKNLKSPDPLSASLVSTIALSVGGIFEGDQIIPLIFKTGDNKYSKRDL
jgi:hypothetical protein